MGTQYRCANQNRRLRIHDPAPGGKLLNGIDWLELLDGAVEKTLGAPPQRTLLVWLFQPPADLSGFLQPRTGLADVVRLDGGVRLRELGIEWVYPAAAVVVAPGGPTAAEKAWFAALPNAARLLVVRTAAYGDFSTYTLSLVANQDDPSRAPPAGFDQVLSHVDFSFKVECPSDFDCAPAAACAPVPAPAPPIDYLAKDYASFKRVILDRLSVIMPDWRERNAGDLGVMLVELLAYAGDQLSYYQDAVGTEAYLGSARRRTSVRRHARLLDYFMHEGANARAWVCLETSAVSATIPRRNPDGTITALLTRVGGDARLDPSRLASILLAQRPTVFEPMHDVTVRAAHNLIFFYTWDDDDCCLPAGATRATLLDAPAGSLALAAGDVLIFEELLGRDTGLQPDADPSRRQAVRLSSATRGTDLLTGAGVVEIEWLPGDALAFPLCLSKKIDGVSVERMAGARGNVVLVDHGLTASEPLAPLPPPPSARYRPTLQRAEVTAAVPYDHAAARSLSAAATAAQDPHAAVAEVALDGVEAWTVRADLLRSDRFAPDFVVEMEEDGSATLRFGDGTLGKLPESNLTATYRAGRGRAGNVGPEALAHVVTFEPSIERVRNPLPASGGIDPESIEEVRLYAPQAFRVQQRAVTPEDYAAAAQRHDEVKRAVATRRWTGSWYTVFVSVDRKGGRPLDEQFKNDLRDFIESFRLAGEDLEMELPLFVPLDLQLVVCVAPGYRRDQVEAALLQTFGSVDLPDGRRGYFHPDNFTFGQPVYLSDVVGTAMKVPGVDWVDPSDAGFRFQRFGESPNQELANGVMPMARLEIARLDNSASLPENGRLTLRMMGGL